MPDSDHEYGQPAKYAPGWSRRHRGLPGPSGGGLGRAYRPAVVITAHLGIAL